MDGTMKLLTDAGNALKDIYGATENDDPYNREELEEFVIPILERIEALGIKLSCKAKEPALSEYEADTPLGQEYSDGFE